MRRPGCPTRRSAEGAGVTGRRTAICGGTLILPGGRARGDVLVADGVIEAVGRVDADGAERIEAAGCLVLPGGIDVHTHVFGGVADDTRSALLGGTTSA